MKVEKLEYYLLIFFLVFYQLKQHQRSGKFADYKIERKLMMKFNIIPCCLFLSLFMFPIVVLGESNFSVKNIRKILEFERYEFKAVGTELKESPVTIEYELININTDSASWKIRGKMPINKTMIEEEYIVRLRDLNVIEAKRKQSFSRGVAITYNEYQISNATDQSNEFVISTIQGLMYILRTFPINNKKNEIIVRMAQQSNKKLGIKIKNKGLVKLNIPKFGDIQAYSISVSLAVPVVGAFLPNVTYFFLDDDVHTLVAMKGAFSMTGKKLDVKLVNYESR